MKVYTQLDGYPGTVGYVMYQDEKGFMWIGTDNGAVVFDGKRFKVIDDRLGLIDKEILVAIPAKGGRVVFSPLLNNLSYYENGKVTTASQDKQLGLLENKTLNHAYKDIATGIVWISDNFTLIKGENQLPIDLSTTNMAVGIYTVKVRSGETNKNILLMVR